MLVVGLTGSVGTGKSTVAAMLARLGCAVIDADAIVHGLMRPGRPGYKKIVRQFGQHILQGRDIDRRKLAGIVFRSPRQLSRLTGILHPLAYKEVQQKLGQYQRRHTKIVVIDAPLLIEAGWHRQVDVLMVVKANRALQIARCVKRGLTRADVLRRMRAQMSMAAKLNMADYVIDNRFDFNATRRLVKAVYEQLDRQASLSRRFIHHG